MPDTKWYSPTTHSPSLSWVCAKLGAQLIPQCLQRDYRTCKPCQKLAVHSPTTYSPSLAHSSYQSGWLG